MSKQERMAAVEKLIANESRPSYQIHYINVLRELEESMRSRLDNREE